MLPQNALAALWVSDIHLSRLSHYMTYSLVWSTENRLTVFFYSLCWMHNKPAYLGIHLMCLHCIGFCLLEGKSPALSVLVDFFNSYSDCWSPTSKVKFSILSLIGLSRKGWEMGGNLHRLIRTDGFCIWLWINFIQIWQKIEFMVWGKLQYLEILFHMYLEDSWNEDAFDGGTFNAGDQCCLRLAPYIAFDCSNIEWNLALFTSALNNAKNWTGWRISCPGILTLSCVWKGLPEYCNLQASAEPLEASNLPVIGWIWRGLSVMCFGSASHHFPKKFL